MGHRPRSAAAPTGPARHHVQPEPGQLLLQDRHRRRLQRVGASPPAQPRPVQRATRPGLNSIRSCAATSPRRSRQASAHCGFPPSRRPASNSPRPLQHRRGDRGTSCARPLDLAQVLVWSRPTSPTSPHAAAIEAGSSCERAMPLPREPSSGAVSAGTACLSPGTTPAYGERVGYHPDTSRSRCSSRSRSRATHHRRDRGAATATTHSQDRSRSAPTGCPAPAPDVAGRVAGLAAPERVGKGNHFAARTAEIATASLDHCSFMQHGRPARRRS